MPFSRKASQLPEQQRSFGEQRASATMALRLCALLYLAMPAVVHGTSTGSEGQSSETEEATKAKLKDGEERLSEPKVAKAKAKAKPKVKKKKKNETE